MTALLAVFAGLALFISGMGIMGQGLQDAAGSGLRRTLELATSRRTRGLALGTLLGFLIQSSAATVMLVGFISAGLMTFAQSIPVMLGINIGTTLSMLMISFRLGDACWIAIAAGLALKALRPTQRSGALGLSLFGFGLIFLGMNIMSDAVRPFRGTLAPLLAYADGNTLKGMLIGVGTATLVTSVIQSSGAVIAMVFAMISAGVITNLEQAWPIILGANVGTCATALLGSIGTSSAARRSAVAHLVFNIFGCIAGIVAAPLVYRYIPPLAPLPVTGVGSSAAHPALIHQCAYANTIKMTISALLMLPLTNAFSRLVSHITPGKKTPDTPSPLNPELLDRPEDALQAALQELARLAGLCRESLRGQARLYLIWDARQGSANQATEAVLDTIKLAMHNYLHTLSQQTLSRRQRILLTMLYTGIDHLERIGDHLAHMATLSKARHQIAAARFIPDTIEAFLDLNQKACTVLTRLQQALAPAAGDRRQAACCVIDACDQYTQQADRQRMQIAKDLSTGRSTPVAALYREELLSDLSRIVKHAKALALDARDRDFRIKSSKLGRTASAPDPENPKRSPSGDLQSTGKGSTIQHLCT